MYELHAPASETRIGCFPDFDKTNFRPNVTKGELNK